MLHTQHERSALLLPHVTSRNGSHTAISLAVLPRFFLSSLAGSLPRSLVALLSCNHICKVLVQSFLATELLVCDRLQ